MGTNFHCGIIFRFKKRTFIFLNPIRKFTLFQRLWRPQQRFCMARQVRVAERENQTFWGEYRLFLSANVAFLAKFPTKVNSQNKNKMFRNSNPLYSFSLDVLIRTETFLSCLCRRNSPSTIIISIAVLSRVPRAAMARGDIGARRYRREEISARGDILASNPPSAALFYQVFLRCLLTVDACTPIFLASIRGEYEKSSLRFNIATPLKLL